MDEIEIKNKFEEFVREKYYNELVKTLSEGNKSLFLDFLELDRFDPELADTLLEEPEKVLKIFEDTLLEFDIVNKRLNVRVFNLPKNRFVRIRDIRSIHLGKLVSVEGLIRQTSDVRPIATEMIFKCPVCGFLISIKQFGDRVREPAYCPNCGKKGGKFILEDKKLIDTQRIVIEESPEILEGGEQPKRLNIFLRDDLVDPKIEKHVVPGNKVRVVGYIKEIPITRGGAKSIKFDIYMEALYIESIEKEFDEIEITEEDVKKIMALAKDRRIYDKLTNSIAPTIAGYNEIKLAIALQLFGGIKKKRADGTSTRGDIHILLVGDPGVGKSLTYSQKILYLEDGIWKWEEIGKFVERFEKGLNKEIYVPSINPNTLKFEIKKVREVIKHKSPEKVVVIKTKSGKKVIVTKDHSLLKFDGEKIVKIKGSEIKKGDLVPTLRKLEIKSELKNKDGFILDYNFGYLLGFFLGDGSILYSLGKEYIDIGNTNREKIELLKNICEKMNLSPLFLIQKRKRKMYYRLQIYEKEFIEWIWNNFYKERVKNTKVKGIKSKLKKIPDWVINSNEEFLKGLINGLWDSDGYEERGFLTISLSNKDIIEKLMLILTRLGIIYTYSEKRYKYKGKIEKAYRLRIVKSKKYNPRADYIDLVVVPKELIKAIRESGLNRRLGNNRKIGGEIRGKIYRGYVGREYGKKIVEILKDSKYINKFESIVKNEYISWEKVIEVREVPIKEIEDNWEYVYDISVEDNENFVSNLIFVHNSQILKYIASIAPKGRYISGKGATGAGLTAVVVRDEFLKGWSLEAGALVLANRGILCIDELDKMSSQDTTAMHEALEQQTITISKANIHATLRAETTVLAAANPKFGRFDPYRTIAEQIDIPPTLINRFDLIFPIRDAPSREKDEMVARHILESHKEPESMKPEIDPELLRKYIAYAKQNCFPKLTEGAIKTITEFYVNLRNKTMGGEEGVKPIPISARQLEALVRLAEASARVRLSDKVLKRDAERAIDLLKYSLMQVGIDPETGELDIDRIVTGISATQRSRIMIIRDIIKELENRLGENIPVKDIIEEAKNRGIDESKAEEILEKMKMEGEIYEPKAGIVRRMPGVY